MTMRVAAIYDIHGNLPALEAALAEIRDVGVDQIVVGGDVVPGAFLRESLERLFDFEVPTLFISGNCEREMFDEIAGTKSSKLPEQYRGIMRWAGEETRCEHERLAKWPKAVQIQIQGLGKVLFCHATPRDDNEIFTRLTPEERLLPVFENVDASVVVCGHTHMQFDRMVGKIRVVNAGSVGMPFGEPGAYWLLLGPGIELRRTEYDLKAAAERIRATKYPMAEEFATRYVLNPPTEKEMLDVFSRAELK
jgi:putative phosphoesterase